MLVGLLIFSGCDGHSADVGAKSCPAGSDSGPAADTADSGDTAAVPECPPFGSAALANSNTAGEHSSDVTICPKWSGIRDAAFTYSVNRAVGSAYAEVAGAVTTEFVATQPGTDPGSFEEVSAAYTDGLLGTQGARMAQWERTLRCDGDGLWMASEWSHGMSFHAADDSPANPLRSGWECSDRELNLLPKELALGTTWTAACSGRWWRLGSVDAADCSFDFTVDEEREIATPGGTWMAFHVVPAASSDPTCLGMGDAIDSYFTNAAGYWVANGVGVIQKTTFDQGEFARISPDY